VNPSHSEAADAAATPAIPPVVARVLRYGVVGGIVMAVFGSLNWLLGHWFGKDVSFILAYPPAVSLHFWLNKKWTFGCTRTDAGRQVSEYLVMVLVTFLIQAAVFKVLTSTTQLPGWAAAVAANAAQMTVTFFAMQFRIFRKDPAAAAALTNL
jgi:putative flippase GtrA